jgi:TonB family protein
VSPASPPADLPAASHGLPLLAGVPAISVTAGDVVLDGRVVGSTAEILAARRLQRVDGLFTSLRQSRDAWKSAHPGAAFPGIALLSFPPGTPAFVVKSVFQTAAFAGYPNAQLAARAPDGSTTRLDVDAMVPGPPGAPGAERGPDELDVVVGSPRVVLEWRTGGAVVSTVEVASGDDLPGRVRSEWLAHGTHRDRSDRALDQAVLFVDDAVDYRGLVAAVDAIDATTREVPGGGDPVSALHVTLSMAKTVPPAGARAHGEHTVNGRMAPEIIQHIVREHFGAFRKCYEAALGRNATLAGKVTVRFVIDPTGAVAAAASDPSSTLQDADAVQCIVRGFGKLVFPPPDGGSVTVVYPIQFNPGD